MSGVLLENLTWREAEAVLQTDTIVVIPLGASCKEHGYHLPLNNDWLMAEYLKQRVLEHCEDVVVVPTLGYHFYPAFKEYPGSVSLRFETARDLVIDLCTSLAAFGPRKFYVLNTGVSTIRALEPAAVSLSDSGILLHFSRLDALLEPVKQLQEQEGGSHADEIETSIMLHMAPHVVKMTEAVKDYTPGAGRLTRDPHSTEGVYSASGVWGDATCATKEKGRLFTEALVTGICNEISALRSAAYL